MIDIQKTMHPEGVPAILDANVIDEEALHLILKLPDHPGDRLAEGLDDGFLIQPTDPARHFGELTRPFRMPGRRLSRLGFRWRATRHPAP